MIYEQSIHVFISSVPLPPGQGMTGQRQPTLQSFNIEVFLLWTSGTPGTGEEEITLGSCLLSPHKTTLMVC